MASLLICCMHHKRTEQRTSLLMLESANATQDGADAAEPRKDAVVLVGIDRAAQFLVCDLRLGGIGRVGIARSLDQVLAHSLLDGREPHVAANFIHDKVPPCPSESDPIMRDQPGHPGSPPSVRPGTRAQSSS